MEARAFLSPRHLPWQHTRQLWRRLVGTQNGFHCSLGHWSQLPRVIPGNWGLGGAGVSGHWARRGGNAQVLSTQVSGSGHLTGTAPTGIGRGSSMPHFLNPKWP